MSFWEKNIFDSSKCILWREIMISLTKGATILDTCSNPSHALEQVLCTTKMKMIPWMMKQRTYYNTYIPIAGMPCPSLCWRSGRSSFTFTSGKQNCLSCWDIQLNISTIGNQEENRDSCEDFCFKDHSNKELLKVRDPHQTRLTDTESN